MGDWIAEDRQPSGRLQRAENICPGKELARFVNDLVHRKEEIAGMAELVARISAWVRILL
jgi:hypothetical protein